MSSYVVCNDTMVRAVHALARRGKPFNGRDLTIRDNCIQLGNELYQLNNKATNGRYGTRKRAPRYVHLDLEPGVPILQLYKSLNCLIYQCSEDKTEGVWLFRQLQDAKAKLAEHIVEHSLEYKACAWE